MALLSLGCADVSVMVGNAKKLDVMKALIPWWFKIIAKIILSRMPIGYGFWQKIGLFRHGYMDDMSYVLNVFNEHVSRAGLTGRLKGKTILELGPGDSIATALVAACYGARAILVDAGAFAMTDMAGYRKLVDLLDRSGLKPPDISAATTLEEMLVICDARYLTQGLESFSSIETGTVDLIFSQAVLEHVRKDEFLDTMRECFRVLTLEGAASHRVDLKDHLGGSANNLRFSSKYWESDWMSSSGFYTNRIRFKEMLSIFKKAGFNIEILNADKWNESPIARKNLAEEFREIDEDDLLISGFDVILKRTD